MLKPRKSRYEGHFEIGFTENAARWVGMLCVGIGKGDIKGELWKIWDEIHENAFVHGYNTAVKDAGKQPTLPGTK